MLQKVTEYACAQLTLVGVRAGNARVGEEKAFLITSVSPEAFWLAAEQGELHDGGDAV